jgi:hypothetical protein
MRTIRVIFIILAFSLVSCKKGSVEPDKYELVITYKVYDKKTGDYSFKKEIIETHGEPLEIIAINCIQIGAIQRCGYQSYSYHPIKN